MRVSNERNFYSQDRPEDHYRGIIPDSRLQCSRDAMHSGYFRQRMRPAGNAVNNNYREDHVAARRRPFATRRRQARRAGQSQALLCRRGRLIRPANSHRPFAPMCSLPLSVDFWHSKDSFLPSYGTMDRRVNREAEPQKFHAKPLLARLFARKRESGTGTCGIPFEQNMGPNSATPDDKWEQDGTLIPGWGQAFTLELEQRHDAEPLPPVSGRQHRPALGGLGRSLISATAKAGPQAAPPVELLPEARQVDLHQNRGQSFAHGSGAGVWADEAGEGFWDALAHCSLWLLRTLRIEGLFFIVQLLLFSLLVQQYLPPLSRYYFDRSAQALLPSSEAALDSMEQLLNQDILLANTAPNTASAGNSTEGVGGGEVSIALAAMPATLSTPADPGQALDAKAVQALLNPTYRSRSYTVQSGESISLLAQRFRINMSTLISVNRIERAKSLRAGQEIQIPNMDGLLYKVQKGDTLQSLAEHYESSIGALIDANQLQSEMLVAGSQIFVPGATLSSYELRKVFGNLYIYPYVGRLSSRFGYRSDPFRRGYREFHNGLDIVGPRGSPVKASSDGVVVSIGYTRLYGNYVILQHAKGIKTLYGHMSKLLAGKGEKVIQGQTIGLIGTSGRSTGPHVHFTIFVGGKAVNPLDYLSSP